MGYTDPLDFLASLLAKGSLSLIQRVVCGGGVGGVVVSWCVGVLCTCMFLVIMGVVCGGVGGTRAVARAAKTVGGRRRNKATTPAARWRRDGGRLELHFPILGGSGCNCNFPRHPFCCAVRLEI